VNWRTSSRVISPTGVLADDRERLALFLRRPLRCDGTLLGALDRHLLA